MFLFDKFVCIDKLFVLNRFQAFNLCWCQLLEFRAAHPPKIPHILTLKVRGEFHEINKYLACSMIWLIIPSIYFMI